MKQAVFLGWFAVCLVCLGAKAQMPPLRDPTLAPNLSGMSEGSGKATAVAPDGPMAVMIVDGKPHLMSGTRLYAQGQMLGQARIERITETEVWLREAGQLRKVQQFPGVSRLISKEKEAP